MKAGPEKVDSQEWECLVFPGFLSWFETLRRVAGQAGQGVPRCCPSSGRQTGLGRAKAYELEPYPALLVP